MTNSFYITSEYEKRSLSALLAEYVRLDTYIVSVLDSQEEKTVDDDTLERFDCVKEVICSRLLKQYGNFTDGRFIPFEYNI